MFEQHPNLSASISILTAVCLGALAGCVAGTNGAPSAANSNSTAAAQIVESSEVNPADKSADLNQVSAAHHARVILPTVVCTNLGVPGIWQRITPPVYNANFWPAAFDVDENTGIVYVGTGTFDTAHSKGVQRSVDCGETWQHVSKGSGSDAINGGGQWTFQVNQVDGRILYTNSGYGQNGLWKSYDGGIDWKEVTPKVDGAPAFAGNLQMDPRNPDHLLLTWHDICYGKNKQFTYVDQVGCFHESKDGGRTWKGHYSADGKKWPAQVRVLLLHDSTWLVLADNALYTSDGGKTYKVVSAAALGGHSSGTLSRADNGAYFIGTQYGAYRSPPESDGQEWRAVGGQWVGDIADTGSLLYETQLASAPLRSSPSADGVKWQDVSAGPTNCEFEHFDVLHKVLYAGCGANGFWRLVVE